MQKRREIVLRRRAQLGVQKMSFSPCDISIHTLGEVYAGIMFRRLRPVSVARPFSDTETLTNAKRYTSE